MLGAHPILHVSRVWVKQFRNKKSANSLLTILKHTKNIAISKPRNCQMLYMAPNQCFRHWYMPTYAEI